MAYLNEIVYVGVFLAILIHMVATVYRVSSPFGIFSFVIYLSHSFGVAAVVVERGRSIFVESVPM